MVTDGSRIQLTIKPMMPAFKSYHDKIQVMAIFAARGWQMTDQIRTVGSLKEKNSHCWWQTNQKDVSFHFWDGNRWRFSQPEWVCNPWIIRDCCVPWNHESNKGMTDEPPKRKLSIVVQTPSCQLNAACIPLEMKDSCTVNSTRQLLLRREFLP